MTPSKFVQFVSIGFGVTVGIISLAVGMWLLSKRAQQRRRERQQQAAELAAAAAVQQPDPRRRRTENVQRMIAEKRKQAAVARKPFLVVQPGKCYKPLQLATAAPGGLPANLPVPSLACSTHPGMHSRPCKPVAMA